MNIRAMHTFAIMAALDGWNAPTLGMYAEGDGGDGGGGGSGEGGAGGAGGEKGTNENGTIREMRAAIAKANADAASARKALGEKESAAAALAAQVEELTHRVDTIGKSEAEKTRIELDRELKKAQRAAEEASKERDTYKTEAESTKSALTQQIINTKLTEQLTTQKALPTAIAQATKLLAIEGNARLEDGKLVLSVGGMDYVDDPKGATAAWLKTNTHFLSSPGGGAGTQNSNTGAGSRNLTLDGLDADTLIGVGLGAPLKR